MNEDPLSRVLSRALRRAEAKEAAEKKLREKAQATRISEDYARRLIDKATFRRLLSDERMDGLRFRWYVSNVMKNMDMDQLRLWIDAKIAEEDSRARNTRQPA